MYLLKMDINIAYILLINEKLYKKQINGFLNKSDKEYIPRGVQGKVGLDNI